jgi:putative NADPH-quinone reductase
MTTVSTGRRKGNFSSGEGEYFLSGGKSFFISVLAKYCYFTVIHYYTFWNVFCKPSKTCKKEMAQARKHSGSEPPTRIFIEG